ncbi:MAG: hypothetical protein Fur0037_04560 [Planctomycetota bacterium]
MSRISPVPIPIPSSPAATPLSLLFTALAACSVPAGDRTGLLGAVVWTQTAAEHDALCEQVFRQATLAIEHLPAPREGSPPRAAIADVDETLLDNSPYQARLVLDQRPFSRESWNEWCLEARAEPLPGAVAFAKACQEHSVLLFYVTNRAGKELEAATRKNLEAAGFPLDEPLGVDRVLCRGDVDGKGDKTGRRAWIEQRYEVVALLGDNLSDFVECEGSTAERREILRRHADELGTRWFLLPNPMYGSWEKAAVAGRRDAYQGKVGALRTMRTGSR